MDKHYIAWSDEIGCEGGPVIVANLRDFMQWHGAEALDPSMATELHYWSPFTGELPPQWQPNGPAGHQYLPATDPVHSREALMEVVLARWPGTVIERGEGLWRATRPDGKKLNVALWPDSEYDRAIRHLGAEGLHRYGQDASAYLWSAAPGMVHIHVAETRELMLLSQVEYADDEAAVRQAYEHVREAGASPGGEGIRYRIGHGPVVVAWSPNSARDASRPLDGIGAHPDQPGTLLDFAIGASGVLLWLEPGTYASGVHYHEGDGWAVSWCSFSRV